MKKIMCRLGLIWMFITLCSCPHVEVDYVGYSDFILSNNSAVIYYYTFEFTDAFAGSGPTSGSVLPGQETMLLSRAAALNGSPPPIMVFSSLTIYSDENHATPPVYTQNPIVMSRWTMTDHPGGGYWSYQVYTCSYN
jgi:hypothetical protein